MVYTIQLKETDRSGVTTTTDITSNVEIGFSIVEKLNEELDIGSMTIMFNERSEPYNMLDTIRILVDSVLIYSMRIGGDTVSLESKNPLLYSHTLSLVEHTKVLERVIISGKTFTQPTDISETQLTLWDLIETLRLVYPFETNDNILDTRKFEIDATQVTYLKSIIAPEFTFKDVTLREALNQVASYVDGVVRLDESNTLSIEFYNETLDLIEEETGNYNKSRTQDIEFYATDMTVDALNMVNDNSESSAIEAYPSENEFITARSDDYIFDFTKSYIPTQKPIYSINKVVARVDLTLNVILPISGDVHQAYIDGVLLDGDSNMELYGYDGVNGNARVLEYNKFRTQENFETDQLGDTTYYQSNTIYYNYGEKNITHSNTSTMWDTIANCETALRAGTKRWLLDNDAYIIVDAIDLYTGKEYTIETVGTSDFTLVGASSNTVGVTFITTGITAGNGTCKITVEESGGTPQSSITAGTENNYMFQVVYTPIPKSIRFNIDRQDLTDVYKKTTIASNQQSRIVNMSNFLDNRQGQINKLGNSELTLNNRVSSLANIYNVGDYTVDKFLLTSKEIIFFNDFFDCVYELSRNWNKRSQFIGVNSEIRQWEIGEKGRTLERDLLYKEYVEIDAVESGSGELSSQFITSIGRQTYLDTFKISSIYKEVLTGMLDATEIPNTILTPTSSNGAGNNLLFRFQFNHNIDGGSYREEKDKYVGGFVIGTQIATQYSSYSDVDDAKLTSFDMYLVDGTNTPTGSSPDTYLERADLLPITELSYITNTLLNNQSELMVYKDNREILSMMYQLQQVSLDINKVILGKALSNRNRLITSNPPTELYLHTYTTEKFGKNDTTTVLDGGTKVSITPTVFLAQRKITVSHANLTSATSAYCIADENDNILIAVNQDGLLLDEITFSFNNKRTGIIIEAVKIYGLEAYSQPLIDFANTANLVYSLRYIMAYGEDLSDLTGTASLVYTDRIYVLEANSSELSEITGTANLVITAVDYALEANSSELSNIIGTAELTYSTVLYSLEAYSNELSDITGIADFTNVQPTEWTVRYGEGYNSNILSTQQVLDGENAIEYDSNLLSRTGYEFSTWSRSRFNITADTDIWAQYTKIEYTVSFMNEGVEYDSQVVDYLDDATTPTPNPTKATDSTYDYTFDSWDTAYTNVTDDITTTAVYNQSVRTDVSWQEVSSGTVTTNQCVNIYDVGNIKEEGGCAFVADGAGYLSGTNETTTIPPCSDGATYTLCIKVGSTWSCIDYIGDDAGTPTLYECQID